MPRARAKADGHPQRATELALSREGVLVGAATRFP